MGVTKKANITRLFIVIILFISILSFKPLLSTLYPFPHRDLTFYYANLHSINPYFLAALIKTESNFNVKAESHKGARGLMQIMPETASWIANYIGLDNFDPDSLYDPEINLKIGSRYVAYLVEEFDNQEILILAAYNGGSGNVKKWLAEGQISSRPSGIDRIPFTETREFVSKVLWTEKIYRFLYDK